MTNQKAKRCVCMDCKERLAKRFDELLYSFDEDTQKTIHELLYVNNLMKGALHTDINLNIEELARKGCVKVNISFAGKTSEGKKIKLKDDVTVRFE